MKKNKIKLYAFEIFIVLFLFIALFVSKNISRKILSLILFSIAMIVRYSFKKRKIIRTNQKEVTILMTALGLLYVGLFYLLGFMFYNFQEQMIKFSFKTLINLALPIALIIISSEILRFTLLSQDGKIRIRNSNIDYSKGLTFIIMVLIDLIIYIGVYDILKLDDFLAIIGFISFASISCNLYYNYYAKRFGIKGIIIYRLITVLYAYIIPIVPNMYIYFRSFLRMLYPYIMYIIMENTYGKTEYVVPFYTKRKNIVITTFIILILSLFTMLISCQFKYGVLVVGSESMTGEVNKGDAIIYKSYSNESINIGDVIIFNYDNTKIVHRVVDIKNVNNETRYYTKGDMNKVNDPKYRIKKDIIGTKELKIKYIGIPTIWLNELFK